MRKAVSLGVVLVLLLGGCQYAGDPAGRQLDGSRPLSFADYVGILQKAAQAKPSSDDPFYPETMELSAESTSFYSVRKCEVVYKDSRFVSFRADTEDYYGGNGNHHVVTVGTIERGSGRILGILDFVPRRQWPTLERRLREGAIRKLGGAENLQDEVRVSENFYFAKDGLHFFYNPYEIACGAAGCIEVVVDPATLER